MESICEFFEGLTLFLFEDNVQKVLVYIYVLTTK